MLAHSVSTNVSPQCKYKFKYIITINTNLLDALLNSIVLLSLRSSSSTCSDFIPLLVLREREMFYLTTHSTHFIYGYMASDIWLRTILIVRKETRCRHIGYSYRLAARVFYMHHPTDRITHTTAFVTPVVEHWLEREIAQLVHPMKDRSDDPPHHERTLYL